MTEGWTATGIDGAVRRRLVVHGDDRGSFTELWRASWTAPLGRQPFVQSNVSRSNAGVLRGMHFHLRQSDLWIVLAGRALVALADLRDATEHPSWNPRTALFELGADEAVVIPERVAHGFFATEDLVLVYLVTNEFDGTDEHAFAWDDPLAAIMWPTDRPTLSAKDRANPSLRDAVRGLQAHRSGA